jgi:autophagy-related protein 2
MAFRRQPDVGPAPDLISDDLPTNPDYLELFSGSAGLRELRDDDLEDFDTQELVAQENNLQPTGLVSLIGGETIRLLRPEGLQIVEHHFDTLVPDTVTSRSK